MRAVLGQLDRLEAKAEAIARVPFLAIVLTRPDRSSWAESLDETRCVRLIGGTKAERRRALTELRKGTRPEGAIVHEHKPGASRFIAEAVAGAAFEVAGWGARGDRKTSAALDAIAILADLHQEAGFPLPLRVMVPTGSHVEHELKLCRTLIAPQWAGLWALRNDRHVAVLTLGGVEQVHLDLFGTQDPGAMDRLRMECHVLWAEEVAPAALEGGAGVSEDAYSLALTSIRLPTPRPVAMLTSNMPDEDAWAWIRFETKPHPSTVSVRIPAGESASAEDRARWAVALQNRPDLMARLLNGQPGSIVQGPQVAKGYNDDLHVARGQRLELDRYAPLVIGQDGGHFPSSVIGQGVQGAIRIHAGLYTPHSGMKQHLEQTLLPWLARWAPWVLEGRGNELLAGFYDPSLDTGEMDDVEQSPLKRLQRTLNGYWRPGAVSWAGRRGPMLAVFNMGLAGRPALQISDVPETEDLRRALSGRWYYAPTPGGGVQPQPKKPNGPAADLGDAFCYALGSIAPGPATDDRPPQRYAVVPASPLLRPGESLHEPKRAKTTLIHVR